MTYKLLLAACLITTVSFAQKDKNKEKDSDKDKKWDIANPKGTFKEVDFTTNEGTWMNLDISPDGKNIVFDMLGDIYTIPVT